MFEVELKYNVSKTLEDELMTSGWTEARVHYTFSPEWEGLQKTACFMDEDERFAEVPVPEDGIVDIPDEALKKSGGRLLTGVYGRSQDKKLLINSTLTCLGKVQQGAIIHD